MKRMPNKGMLKAFSVMLSVMLLSVSFPITGYAAGTEISIQKPGLTNRSVATVTVSASPAPANLYYRLSEKVDWKEITANRTFQITDNTFVYIQAVNADGVATEFSDYIECFDRANPTFTTTLNGTKLTISAKDNLSGVKAIYINDDVIEADEFDSANDDYRIVNYTYRNSSGLNSVVIQVEDEVGNISKTSVVTLNRSTSSSSSNYYQDSDSYSTTSGTSGTIGNASILIIPPNWTNQTSALVKIQVNGNNVQTISAKIGRKGDWFKVGDTMDFTIKENSEVYVKVVDTDGKITTESAQVFCFDIVLPTVTAQQDGNSINIIAEDELSGVAFVYVNGKPYTPDAAGGVTVPVDNKVKFTIQAKDQAGNLSEIATVTPSNYSGSSSGSTSESSGDTYNITIGDNDYTLEELKALGLPIYIFPNVDDETVKVMLETRRDELYRQNPGIALNRKLLYKEVYDKNGNLFWLDEKGNFILFDADGIPVEWDGDTAKEWYDIDGNPIAWDANGLQVTDAGDAEYAFAAMTGIEDARETGAEEEATTKDSKKGVSLGDIVIYSLVAVIGGIVLFVIFLRKKEKESFSPDDLYAESDGVVDNTTDFEVYSNSAESDVMNF